MILFSFGSRDLQQQSTDASSQEPFTRDIDRRRQDITNQLDSRQRENGHQSVSEKLNGGNLRDEVQDTVTELSQGEVASSGMASDTSDFSEHRRFISREGEWQRMGTDSDQSASSSLLSEGSRKRRKDKSSMRKSKLNEASEGRDLLFI